MVDIKASSNVEDNIESPWGPFLYTASTLHCMTVSLALDGEGLGTAWGARAYGCSERPASAVDVKEIETDPFNSYFVARTGAELADSASRGRVGVPVRSGST